MKKLFGIILTTIMMSVIFFACSETTAAPVVNTTTEVTAASFIGIWVADTVFADQEWHSMDEYDLVMIFKIEDGLARLGEKSEAYGSNVQDFSTSFADGKLTLTNDNEKIVLSFDENNTLVWAGDEIIYTFYLFEEE